MQLNFILLNLPLVISGAYEYDLYPYKLDKLEVLLDFSLLANYNGQGSCKEMIFKWIEINEMLNEHLGPWAKAVNWKFTQVDEREIIIKR